MYVCLPVYGDITYRDRVSNLNHHHPDTRTDWTFEVSIEKSIASFSTTKKTIDVSLNLQVSRVADTWACVLLAL